MFILRTVSSDGKLVRDHEHANKRSVLIWLRRNATTIANLYHPEARVYAVVLSSKPLPKPKISVTL